MSAGGIPDVKMSTNGIPDVKMSRAAKLSKVTPSGFPKRTCGALPYLDSLREKISYHDMLSGSLTFATIRWCVRTPCPDIFCHGFQRTLLNLGLLWWSKSYQNTKTNTIWLELIAKVLNMLIGLKDNNYYSKVFKRVKYKLWNNIFWVVIKDPTMCL